MKPRYIIVRLRARKSAQLFRPNGELIAVLGGNLVQFGEHPMRTRAFINEESAFQWLAYYAALDEFVRREACGPIHEAIESGLWDSNLTTIDIDVREGDAMVDIAQSVPAGILKN